MMFHDSSVDINVNQEIDLLTNVNWKMTGISTAQCTTWNEHSRKLEHEVWITRWSKSTDNKGDRWWSQVIFWDGLKWDETGWASCSTKKAKETALPHQFTAAKIKNFRGSTFFYPVLGRYYGSSLFRSIWRYDWFTHVYAYCPFLPGCCSSLFTWRCCCGSNLFSFSKKREP